MQEGVWNNWLDIFVTQFLRAAATRPSPQTPYPYPHHQTGLVGLLMFNINSTCEISGSHGGEYEV
jgi:hypothetical protein